MNWLNGLALSTWEWVQTLEDPNETLFLLFLVLSWIPYIMISAVLVLLSKNRCNTSLYLLCLVVLLCPKYYVEMPKTSWWRCRAPSGGEVSARRWRRSEAPVWLLALGVWGLSAECFTASFRLTASRRRQAILVAARIVVALISGLEGLSSLTFVSGLWWTKSNVGLGCALWWDAWWARNWLVPVGY